MSCMEKEDNIYIKVLLWAYGKQQNGFTWEELRCKFNLNDLQEKWIKKIFLTADDRDRKFFEHFRNDESVTPNVHYYSLNEKGMSAAINYKELKRAEENSKHANWFAGLAVFMAIVTLIVTTYFQRQTINLQIESNNSANRALEIYTEPQIQVYIKRKDINDRENFIIGIENNGISSVKNLRVGSSIINMDKASYLKGEENASAVLEDLFIESKFNPSDQKQRQVFIENKGGSYIGIIYLNIKYEREVDMREFSYQAAFFTNGFSVYSFDEIKDVLEWEPIVKSFKLYTSGGFGFFDQKLYGQPF